MLMDLGLLIPKFQPFPSYNDYPVNNKEGYNATLVRDVLPESDIPIILNYSS